MAPGHSLQTGFVRSDTGTPQQANLDASGNVQVNVVGGGGTGGGPATIADGADVAEGSTADAAWVSGAGTVISLLKKIASGGGGSAVSIANGSDVAEGTTTDAAITTDTSGTVIGFLRGVVKMLASVWDSANGRLKVDGSAVTQPISGTVTAATNGTSASATLLNLNDEVRIALGNNTGASFSIASTIASGVLRVEGSLNGGTTWHDVRALRKSPSSGWLANAVASGSAAGSNWEILPAYSGTTHIRVRVSVATTPSNVVTLFTGQATYVPTLLEGQTGGIPAAGLDQMLRIGGTAANGLTDQIATFGSGVSSASLRVNLATDVGLPAGSNTIGKLGGGNVGVVIGDVRLIDALGGTTAVTVKAGSTDAVSTDTALVVRSVQIPLTLGQKTMANSLAVAIASDQSAVPVSGTVTTSPPANASTDVAQLAGTATSVNSGVKDAGTLRVVLATDQPALTNKLLVTPDSVALPANQSVNAAQFGGTNVATGTGASGAGVPRVTVANDSNVIVTPPTLTKGTQAATGFSTQDLKDSGRNQTNYFMAAPVACTTAEVMQSLTGYKSGAAVGATATPAVVTSGKTYRIDKIKVTIIALTAIGSARINLRANLSGSGVIGSPLVMSYQVGIPAIFTAGSAETYSFDYSEGMEFPAGTGLAIGVIGEGADGTTGTAVAKVMVSLHGYEY